jgi:hypothetical protein
VPSGACPLFSPATMKYDRPELAQRHPCLCNAPPPPLSPTSVPPRYSISAMDCPTHCTVPCWNVERGVTSSSKSTKGCWHNIPVRPPIRRLAPEVKTTCHRPLERSEEVNPLGSVCDFAGTTPQEGTTQVGSAVSAMKGRVYREPPSRLDVCSASPRGCSYFCHPTLQ